MVTPAKPKLYVYQTTNMIVVSWEKPPDILNEPDNPTPLRYNWKTNVLYHPDVDIFVSKTRLERGYRHTALGHSVMVALEDAGIAVAPLRREKTRYTRKKVKEELYVTLEMFPE